MGELDKEEQERRIAENQARFEEQLEEEKEKREEAKTEAVQGYDDNLKKLDDVARNLRLKYPIPDTFKALRNECVRRFGSAKANQTALIACVGASGVGKSSWVGAALKSDHSKHWKPKDLPGTGSVGETTIAVKGYPYSPDGGNTYVMLADCPGGGTPRFPSAEYVQTVGLRYYDVVLFFVEKRWSECDLEIIQDCIRNDIE